MADSTTVELNPPHAPHENAVRAFTMVDGTMRHELIKLRHHWNLHEPQMFKRATGLSDAELTDWNLEEDLVEVRSGTTSYGTLLFGKIRIPALVDGYVHVRIHDPVERGQEDVTFHSFFTDEVRQGDKVVYWQAIQSKATPLEFFNE